MCVASILWVLSSHLGTGCHGPTAAEVGAGIVGLMCVASILWVLSSHLEDGAQSILVSTMLSGSQDLMRRLVSNKAVSVDGLFAEDGD
ncbi:hypothetical protein U1Q18_015312 [Sarracenia purpurea var. burkii]